MDSPRSLTNVLSTCTDEQSAYSKPYNSIFDPSKSAETVFRTLDIFNTIFRFSNTNTKIMLLKTAKINYLNGNNNTFRLKVKEGISFDELDKLILLFPNLTFLDFNNAITDTTLKSLRFLETLRINSKITDFGLKALINLTHLELYWNPTITNEGIKKLIKLTYLDLCDNEIITDDGIQHLTNLTYLNLCDAKKITVAGLKYLTKLSQLDLSDNKTITAEGIKYLTNMTYLNLTVNHTRPCCIIGH